MIENGLYHKRSIKDIESGETLPFAMCVKGTKTGATTNVDGILHCLMFPPILLY